MKCYSTHWSMALAGTVFGAGLAALGSLVSAQPKQSCPSMLAQCGQELAACRGSGGSDPSWYVEPRQPGGGSDDSFNWRTIHTVSDLDNLILHNARDLKEKGSAHDLSASTTALVHELESDGAVDAPKLQRKVQALSELLRLQIQEGAGPRKSPGTDPASESPQPKKP